MESSLPIIDKINAIYGVLVAVLSYIFGQHWILFVGFAVLNVMDYLTGCMKARINGKSNSNKGADGVIKKLGYWAMIFLAFFMNSLFVEMGNSIGVNLNVTQFIGWFVLASLIINEIRSIIENFVEAGYNPPAILIKGLEIANKAVEAEEKTNTE